MQAVASFFEYFHLCEFVNDVIYLFRCLPTKKTLAIRPRFYNGIARCSLMVFLLEFSMYISQWSL